MHRTLLAVALMLGSAGQAAATSDNDLKEMSALIINLNGGLCARVTSITPAAGKDNWNVSCIENRDGSGRVSYIMNARQGTAVRR